MTKEDMILSEIQEISKTLVQHGQDVAVLKHITSSLDEIKNDMAVLKSKHDTGNRSERLTVIIAGVALVVSMCVGVVSCKECVNEKSKRPIAVDFRPRSK